MTQQTNREGNLYITFGAYLSELRAQEKQKPPGQRREVPTSQEVADAAGVHLVTMTNIANGKIQQLNLETARKALDYLWHRGFHPQLTDFLKYIPPEE